MSVFKGRIIQKEELEDYWIVKIKDDTNNDFYKISLNKSNARNVDSFLSKTDVLAYYNEKTNNIPYFYNENKVNPLQSDKDFRFRKNIGYTASCIITFIISISFFLLGLALSDYFLSIFNANNKTIFAVKLGVMIFTIGFSSTNLMKFFQKEASFVKDLKEEFYYLELNSRRNRK